MDIAPELYDELKTSFETKYNVDSRIRSLLKKMESGRGTYVDASKYAIRCGELLSQTFGVRIDVNALPDGTLYYNIADRTVRPMLENNYRLVADYCDSVQKTINRSAGLGLNPIRPEMNNSRIQGLVDLVSDGPYEEAKKYLKDPVINFSQSVVDDSIESNAGFQYRAGLRPKIIRHAEFGACPWCVDLEGEYDYPCDPAVYQRHENCRCITEYEPGDGGAQDVWSKKWR